MRKIYLEMKVTACVLADDDTEIDDIISGMSLCSDCEGADLLDSSIEDYKITDSK